MRNNRYIRAADWVQIAQQIAAQHNGVLPNAQALIDAGYWALYQQMRRNPRLFKHIKQARLIPRRGPGRAKPSATAQPTHVGSASIGTSSPRRGRRPLPARAGKLAPTCGRGAWVRMLVASWRHGQLYRTDMPASVLTDGAVQQLVFKPPDRQRAVTLRKNRKLIAWFQALPRRLKGTVIGPFDVDVNRRRLTW